MEITDFIEFDTVIEPRQFPMLIYWKRKHWSRNVDMLHHISIGAISIRPHQTIQSHVFWRQKFTVLF